MRTLIDLDQAQIRELDDIARAAGRSRASLIREAVADLLKTKNTRAHADAFGLWGDRQVDGLVYQRTLRAEW